MPKASELKRGMVVELADAPYMVKDVQVRNPSSRGASTLYKVRFNHLKTGQKRDESLKGDEVLKSIDCERTALQYSYQDGDSLFFMDENDYSQYALPRTELEAETGYLHEGLGGITGILMDGQLLAIELPASVVMEIVETTPGIKGATAAARTKPARLSTGLEVQVPEYIETGERIKIHTETGKYIARA